MPKNPVESLPPSFRVMGALLRERLHLRVPPFIRERAHPPEECPVLPFEVFLAESRRQSRIPLDLIPGEISQSPDSLLSEKQK